MSMPKKTMAALDEHKLSCTSTTKSSTEIITAPRDTRLLGNHKSVAKEFDAAVFLSGFHRKETISLLSCLKPTEIQELVDICS